VSWQWLNLAAPEFEAPSDPPYIAGLIYPGLRHVLSGSPESAKTLVGLILALTVQRQNELVAHIDFEMGPKRTRTLLEDLGATADEIADHIYTETGGPPDEADLAHLTVNGVALALIDAGAGAYNASGLDDHSRKDVETFGSTWIDPLYRASVGTLLVDHVVKNTDNRGKWAIGSERKAGQADVDLGLELIGKPLSRGGSALVKVRVHKDRPAGSHARTQPSSNSSPTRTRTGSTGRGSRPPRPRRARTTGGRRSTWSASAGTSSSTVP
jgi:hypothetical protein